jgi:hypothetical protein
MPRDCTRAHRIWQVCDSPKLQTIVVYVHPFAALILPLDYICILNLMFLCSGCGLLCSLCPHAGLYFYFDSSVGIVTGYGAGRLRGRVSSPSRVKNFFFSTASRPTFWVYPASCTVGTGGRGMKQFAHLQLVLRSRKRGCIHPSPPIRLHGVIFN